MIRPFGLSASRSSGPGVVALIDALLFLFVGRTPTANSNRLARGGLIMTMPISNHSIDRAAFENFYAGKAPWDIGKPQGPFVAVADRLIGPILDAGCGTGEHAMFFAARGHWV